MPDEDDRSREGSSAADASWAAVVVPDDISALASEVAAYRRELRAARRRDRIQRLIGGRPAFPLVMVTIALVVAATVASLLTLLTHGTVGRTPRVEPLATTTVAAGHVGGLLPVANLVPSAPASTIVSSRAPALRHTVVALIGPNCNCADVLDDLARAADSEDFPLAIVVSAASDPFSVSYSGQSHLGQPAVYFDRAGVIASTVQAHGVTAVVVGSDGVIYAVQPQANQTNIRTDVQVAVQQAALADQTGS